MIHVPIERFRTVVERWIAEFDSAEVAYQALAAAGPLKADAWRFRLSDGTKTSKGVVSRGWFTYQELPESDVDEFLSLADLNHVWWSEFCDLMPTVGKLKAKPKKRGVPHRVPDDDLRKMHRLHVGTERLSLNQIAKQTWERYGYASRVSCATSISNGWRRLGLRARDRIEMTVAVSTVNGLSPRDWQTRKERRLAAGLTQYGRQREPACARDGCKETSMHDAEWCHVHHPDRQDAAMARLAEMRSRSPRQNPANLTTAAEIQPALADYWHRYGSGKPLADATGIDQSVLCRYRKADPGQKVMLETVARIWAGLAVLEAMPVAA